MHFARSEEQSELATVVADLLAKRSDSEAVRRAMSSDTGFDPNLWQALCEQVGVAALCVPEQYDGFGASLIETGVVLEELGKSLAPTPLLSSSIAATALVLFGDDEAKWQLLPRISSGEAAAVCLDSVVLDGGSPILLSVDAGDLSLVENPRAEVISGLDQTLRFASVEGSPRKIGEIADPEPLHAIAAALATALAVGGAQRGLDMTVAYSKEREQFGRPIGSFQALKHRMADMLVLVEAGRSASWGAIAAAAAYVEEPNESNWETLWRRAAAAQSWCSDAFDKVASEVVQLHGGIAITWEHDAHLIFKRAHALSQLFGRAHAHRARLIS